MPQDTIGSQKNGALTGGSATDEALASSRTVLAADRSGNARGLQQYFTPRDVSAWLARVVGADAIVFDPTAGNGALLSAFAPDKRFGVELDADQIAASRKVHPYRAWRGDIQHFASLAVAVGARFPVVACNPPFGLSWEYRGAKGSSTAIGFKIALDLLTDSGVGVFLCGTDRLERELFEYRSHFAFHVDVADLFPGVRFPCTITLFTKQPGADADAERVSIATPAELTPDLAADARSALYGRAVLYSLNRDPNESGADKLLNTAHAEYERRLPGRIKSQEYSVEIRSGRLSSRPSGYTQLSLAQSGRRALVEWLHSFDRQPASWFALQSREWRRLSELAADVTSGVTIAPAARTAIEAAILDAARDTVPMYPVNPLQRLGFVADLDKLECVQSDPARGFVAGQSYPIDTRTAINRVTVQKAIQTAKGPDVADFTREKQCMEVILRAPAVKRSRVAAVKAIENRQGGACTDCGARVGPWDGEAYLAREGGKWDVRHREGECSTGGEDSHVFGESNADIEYLLSHFALPDPGDVATRFPAELARWRDLVDAIEREIRTHEAGFSFRWFQKDDVARLAFKGRGVLGWEQGLGKTLGQMSWARALELAGATSGDTLFVMPQDLIPQFATEARRFFGRDVLVCDRGSKNTARRVGKRATYTAVEVRDMVAARRADPSLPPIWCVTWYEALAVTGRASEFPAKPTPAGGWRKVVSVDPETEKETTRRERITSETHCPECGADETTGYAPGGVGPCKGLVSDKGARALYVARQTMEAAQRKDARGEQPALYPTPPPPGRRCTYVAGRTLRVLPAYSILKDVFDAVSVDEATKIKGDSLQSRAIRAFRPTYRIAASGTPLKNKACDLFWVLWWALGDSCARMPYAYANGAARFTDDYCVKEFRAHGKKAGVKILDEVSNLSRLWRTLCGALVRRRADEVGVIVETSGAWKCHACGAAHAHPMPGAYAKPSHVTCTCGRTWDTMPPTLYRPIVVPWGAAQKKFYSWWLDKGTFAAHFRRVHPETDMSDSMIGLMAAMLGQLQKLQYGCTDPMGDPDPDVRDCVEGLSDWTPIRAKILELAIAAVGRGEKVLIGSSLVAPGPWIAARLCEAGINAVHIADEDDEGNVTTKNPKARAKMIAAFRNGSADVLCVGIKAISLGHNLDNASRVIAAGLPWDFSTWDQFVKRARRLTSRKPITVDVVMPDDSLESRIWAQLGDKTNVSDLALDARLHTRTEERIDPAQLLRELQEAGCTFDGTEVPESELAAKWARQIAGKEPFTPAPIALPPPEAAPVKVRRARKPRAPKIAPATAPQEHPASHLVDNAELTARVKVAPVPVVIDPDAELEAEFAALTYPAPVPEVIRLTAAESATWYATDAAQWIPAMRPAPWPAVRDEAEATLPGAPEWTAINASGLAIGTSGAPDTDPTPRSPQGAPPALALTPAEEAALEAEFAALTYSPPAPRADRLVPAHPPATPKGWHRGPVTLRMDGDTARTVDAEIFGELALTPDPDGGTAVTHVRTGLAIRPPGGQRKGSAERLRRFAEALEPAFPWATVANSFPSPEQQLAATDARNRAWEQSTRKTNRRARAA